MCCTSLEKSNTIRKDENGEWEILAEIDCYDLENMEHTYKPCFFCPFCGAKL